MHKWLLLALAAGVASGLLNAGAAVGSILALTLSHLTLLPLFLAGLGIGLPGALAAGAAGTLVAGLAVGPAAAAVYLAVDALPVLLLCRQALLSRGRPDGSAEWYPGGLLLCWLMGVVAALYLLVLGYFELFEGGLLAAVRRLIELYVDSMGGMVPEEGRQALLASAPMVPGIAASYYMLNTLLNAALAQHLLRRSGHNLRPSVVFSELRLPRPLLGLLLGGIVVAMLSRTLAPVALTLVFVLVVAYFLLGLAVVHALLARWPNRGAALFGFYVVLILLMMLFPVFGAMVVGLGAAEQAVGVRRRFAGGGKEND